MALLSNYQFKTTMLLILSNSKTMTTITVIMRRIGKRTLGLEATMIGKMILNSIIGQGHQKIAEITTRIKTKGTPTPTRSPRSSLPKSPATLPITIY